MLFIYVQKLFAHCFVLYSSVSLRDAKENIYYFTWRSHIFDTKLSLQCHLVPKRLAALKKEFHSLAGHAIKKTAHPAKTDNKEELRAKVQQSLSSLILLVGSVGCAVSRWSTSSPVRGSICILYREAGRSNAKRHEIKGWRRWNSKRNASFYNCKTLADRAKGGLFDP